MRCVFYVAVAVAILSGSSVVAAFTNADEFTLSTKITPDFAVSATISSDFRKRFLRVTDPENEERTKYASLSEILAKLREKDMHHVADILKNMGETHAQTAVEKAVSQLKLEDYQAAKNLLQLGK
ncbi:Avirulence (Avh) protein [Phytophthora megakarya]|uniref:RxLR effector protein n=1 Tax=Phytophthora megakarya TaxID=4795 RepID=A0A225VML2_9STRA|nr:Avirulence (Avh) protein [Phytophthora megakarya]